MKKKTPEAPKKLELKTVAVRHLDLRRAQGGRADTEYPTCGGSIACAGSETLK